MFSDMPRRPNTKSTNIYWLYDMRPETIALFGPEGQPFYCGKTISKIEYRLTAHRGNAPKHPNRPTYAMLLICGEHVRTVLVETVPLAEDWCAAERRWIAALRRINPNCTNRSDGGDGAPGNVQSAAMKATMRAKMTGRVFAPETIAKMSARMVGTQIRRGKKLSAEASARQSERQTGRKLKPHRPEVKARIAESNLGKKRSEETKAALRAAWEIRRLTPVSAETRAKIGAAHKNRVFSAETRIKMRAAWVRRKAGTVAMQIPPPPY